MGGASSSSTSSSSPSGTNFVPNLYSPPKGPGSNNGFSNNSSKPLQSDLQTRASQYSAPISLPPRHNAIYQTNFQGSATARPNQPVPPICFDKKPIQQETIRNDISMSRNLG